MKEVNVNPICILNIIIIVIIIIIIINITIIRGLEDVKNLSIWEEDKEDRQQNYIKNRINKGRAVTAMLWNRQITRKKY